MKLRTYDELIQFDTFLERYRYLRLGGRVGDETFGFERYLNQVFYRTDPEWLDIRKEVIIRDGACDLGISDREINDIVIIHHLNPLTKNDIIYRTEFLLDPKYLICTSRKTHNAIHYGNGNLLILDPIVRRPNDTCPWRR